MHVCVWPGLCVFPLHTGVSVCLSVCLCARPGLSLPPCTWLCLELGLSLPSPHRCYSSHPSPHAHCWFVLVCFSLSFFGRCAAGAVQAMIEVLAKLGRGPVFLAGEMLECVITFTNPLSASSTSASRYDGLWALLCVKSQSSRAVWVPSRGNGPSS